MAVKQVEIVTCEECGKEIPEGHFIKEYVTVSQHKEKSWDLDWETWVTDVFRYDYSYDCPHCQHKGYERGPNQAY